MKHYYITLMLMSAMTLALSAKVPEGYYDSLDGLRDESLKDELHNIIRPHTTLSYNSLWDYFPTTDVYPELVNGKRLVWDMYSDNLHTQKYYYPNGTSGLNREHSVPKSWWGSGDDAIYDYQAGTDITHLLPSDGSANMSKSNYPLGVVADATFDNGVSKTGTPINGQGGGSARVFEPDDQYKGDFARIYFYMVTCYQDYTWRYNYMFTNSTYLSLKDWAINMLLDWSRNDPVSQKEIDRNEAVYRIQGNRNPFVDDSELVEYIWGDRRGETYSVEHYDGDPVLISPTQDSEVAFGEVAINSTQNIPVNVKGAGLVGDISVTVYGTNRDMFSVTTTSIPASSANTTNGYQLNVTYKPTALGDHTARLLLSDGGIAGTGIGVSLTGSCLPVPTLSRLTALPATDVTATSYCAQWSEAPETIDYYTVKRTIYSNGSESTEYFQSEENYLTFTDLKPGEVHTYSVQSSRLGYLSEPSNTITVNSAGVQQLENDDRPLAVTIYYDQLIQFSCEEPHTGCRIYDISGRLMRTIDTIEPGMMISLPYGAYLITTDQCHTPIKVLVR